MEFTNKSMVHEDDEEMDIYFQLQTHADANPSYNTKFLDSVEKFLKQNKQISGEQFNVLVKMYNNLP